ncbi:hypothetical protein GQR58_014657 [Nymphon striatum]|nr:hypothetical protein GQR58_014657 [Nymphon striatum]
MDTSFSISKSKLDERSSKRGTSVCPELPTLEKLHEDISNATNDDVIFTLLNRDDEEPAPGVELSQQIDRESDKWYEDNCDSRSENCSSVDSIYQTPGSNKTEVNISEGDDEMSTMECEVSESLSNSDEMYNTVECYLKLNKALKKDVKKLQTDVEKLENSRKDLEKTKEIFKQQAVSR